MSAKADILGKIGVSKRHWYCLLAGERNASPNLAKRIESKTGIDRALFVFGTAPERRAEWKRYLKSLEAEAKQ